EKWDIPDSLVVDYYYDNIHLFSSPREINVQEIIVADKLLADSLYELLLDGGDFGNFARMHSIRDWSAQNNGVLGLAPLSKFGIFKQLLWDAPLAEIVGPLQLGRLYGIFRVTEKKDSVPFKLSAIKNEVRTMAKRERQKSVFINYIQKCRSRITPFIDEHILSSYKFNF
ncbi:peptidylprolyl isomerase, partial [Bacteroidota bacterium]